MDNSLIIFSIVKVNKKLACGTLGLILLSKVQKQVMYLQQTTQWTMNEDSSTFLTVLWIVLLLELCHLQRNDIGTESIR